jgi:hypothetical protein
MEINVFAEKKACPKLEQAFWEASSVIIWF